MTSARAYRPGRSNAAALRELWRCAGAEFDAEIVQALAATLPSTDTSPALDTRSVISPPRMPRLPAIAAASNGS